MEKPKADSHLGAILGGSLAVLVAVYFLLPVVWLVPLEWGFERGFVSQAVADSVFLPLDFFADRVPAYAKLVTAESQYCLEKGFPPPHN